MPKPVIAAVNGPAVGIGCSLALDCDLVLAAESAYFLLAFVNIGLVPDGGSTALVPARAGVARAMEMGMLGERVPAEQALDWGLVNRVLPDDRLIEDQSCARASGRRPDQGLRELQEADQPPVYRGSRASSRPRPTPSASRATPPTSSRACWPSSRSARRVQRQLT